MWKKYPFKIPNYHTTTNGLLLGKDVIITNNFKVLVSLDGTKESHDEHRINKFKKPSFDIVFSNLNKPYQKDPKFFKNNISFSVVRTPANCSKSQLNFLDNLCKERLFVADVDRTKYFTEILKNKLKSKKIKKVDITEFNFFKHDILKKMKNYHYVLSREGKVSKLFCTGTYCIPGLKKNFINPDGKIILCEKVDERNPIYFRGCFLWNKFRKNKKLIWNNHYNKFKNAEIVGLPG